MVPLLPHQDPDPEGRRARIRAQKDLYRYDHDYLPTIPMLKDLPGPEAFSPGYVQGKQEADRAFPVNEAAWRARLPGDAFDSLEDFEYLFQTLPRPGLLRDWTSDRSFGEARLSGANPMKLSRVRSLDELPFRFGRGRRPGRLPGFEVAVDAAIGEGALYLVDYDELSWVEGGDVQGLKKYLPAARGLFYWEASAHPQKGRLLPVGVEVRRGGSFYTPGGARSPLEWLLAKTCLQVADANYHEMVAHLCHTHIVMEPIAVAAARNLAPDHPVAVLLRPHFRFLFANNFAAVRFLVNQGGFVDQLLAGRIDESLGLTVKAFHRWDLGDHSFPADLARRGLDDPAVLPHYPYRDDGKLLWEATRRHVARYLGLYYRSDRDFFEDRELGAWAHELSVPGEATVRGFPDRILSRDHLEEVLTTLLFTCGPQHSAVNFAQYEYMAFAPALPTALYQPPPEKPGPIREAALMRFLPPPERALLQMRVACLLTSYRHDRYGHYPEGDFTDPEALAAIRDFQAELARAETVIQDRNRLRDVPYPYLQPSLVTNSISV